MPKINVDYKRRSGRMVWDRDDFISGMNREGFNTATHGRSLLCDGVLGAVNPFNPIGVLSLCPGPEDLTNHATVANKIMGMIDDGNYVYGITSAGKIHKANRTTGAITTTSWPHTITVHGGHSGLTGEDIIIYNQGGTDYAFYSWSDTTDGDVGRFNLDATFDDDYMSTVPGGGAVQASTFYHPMITVGGYLFIGDGNKLNKLDNTTYTAGALTLPNGYIITSFAFYDDYLVIYAHRKTGATLRYTEAKAFFWDYVSPDFNFSFTLNDNTVNGGFTFNGIPGCFTGGFRNTMAYGSNISKLKLFDGRKFSIIESFKDVSLPGKNSVFVSESFVQFLIGTGSTTSTLYSYGSPDPGIAPTLLKVANIIGDEAGALLPVSAGATSLLWSSTNGNVNHKRWQRHSGVADNASVYLLSAFPSLNKRDKMLITNVTVKFYKSSGTAGYLSDLSLFIDQHTNKQVIDSLQTTTNNEKKEYTKMTNGNTLGTAEQSVGIYLSWTNVTLSTDYPKIREIIVDFNIIN